MMYIDIAKNYMLILNTKNRLKQNPFIELHDILDGHMKN